MSAVDCPHCAVANDPAAAFCGTCGKAMPIQSSGGPRLIKGGALATSAAGQQLQSIELIKKMKNARTILLVLGTLQLVLGTCLFIGFRNVTGPDADLSVVGIAVAIVGFIFVALGVWATKAPFPAALTGLIIFLTLTVADAVANPLTLVQGLVVKVIVIAVLAKAVSAGLQHRQLRRQMEKAA